MVEGPAVGLPTYRLTPRSELDRRLAALQLLLEQNDLDGAVIVQRADLFYFSGTTQQAHLFLPRQGRPLLMVRKSYARARWESALDDVVSIQSLSQLPLSLSEHGFTGLRRLGWELDVLPTSLYLRYRELFPQTEMVDASSLIRQVRARKSLYEIAIIREAAALLDRMTRAVPAMLREGMTELELAAELERLLRLGGHQGLLRFRAFNQELFYGQVLSGPAGGISSGLDMPVGGHGLSPAFPQSASHRRIGRSEPVVVDFMGAIDGYLADQTRVFSLGPLPDRLIRAYEVALYIQEEVKRHARPGVPWGELYRIAVETATRFGFAEHFMGYREGRVSFIGHGVGLEVDEYPFLARGFTTPLEVDMVFAMEPKLVFPGEGVVGIENTYLVTEGGLEQLTHAPEELGVV